MNFKLSIAALAIVIFLAAVAFAASGPSFVVEKKEQPPPKLKPGDVTAEEGLKCSNLSSRYERISCRIQLKQENELNYLPEECRQLLGADREECKDFYSSVQVCWTSKDSPVGCAMKVVGLGDSVAAAVNNCNSDKKCVQDVAGKVHLLNKFRLYNLEWKAEYLKEQEGIDINHELLVDLVSNLEQKKLEYNEAETIKEKKQVLREAQQIWQSFAKKVRGKVK